jgi:hypothetical protein
LSSFWSFARKFLVAFYSAEASSRRKKNTEEEEERRGREEREREIGVI